MVRFLVAFNVIGIGAMATLCVLQWRGIARLNAASDVADKTISELRESATKEAEAHRRAEADLVDARDRLAAAQAAESAATTRATTAEAEVVSLRAGVDRYRKAVAERDAVLIQQQLMVKKWQAARDEMVKKYNELLREGRAKTGP